MNRHLALRSGNPTLNAKTFSGFDLTTGASMTIMGTVNKTAFSLLLLMTTALLLGIYLVVILVGIDV